MEYSAKISLENAQEIKRWCKKRYKDKPIEERDLPEINSSDEEESKLAKKLKNIRSLVLKKYEGIELDEIKHENHRKIVEIIRTLDKEYGLSEYLKNAIKIQKWCKKHYGDKPREERDLPEINSSDEEERELGMKLRSIRYDVSKQYEGVTLEEIEDENHRQIVRIIRELDKEYGISEYLKNAIKIQKWCEKHYGDKEKEDRCLPRILSQNTEEKRLANALVAIERYVLKQYKDRKIEKIENEEHREIATIVKALYDEYGLSISLKNVIKIKKWCDKNYGELPRDERKLPTVSSLNEEEAILGRALREIRYRILSKYEGKNIEKIENEEHREIVKIMQELDRDYMSEHQRKIRDTLIAKRMKNAVKTKISDNKNTRDELEINRAEVDKKTGYPDSPEDK